MWPFRRKENSPSAAPIAAPVIRSDWKKMPALQRAIGEHPLTAPGEPFAGALATRSDPSVVSRTLGHHVTADAPPGLVLAVGSFSTRSDGPAMMARPRVQRRAATAADAVDTTEVDAADMAAGPPLRPLPTTGGAQADVLATSASVAAQPAATTPVVQTYRRELPVVATAEPAGGNLTGLAPDVMPVPVGPGRRFDVQRSVAPSISPAQAPETVPMAPQELGGAPAKLTLGQSRRLGLGAPLRQVPPGSVQRSTAGPESPIQQAASPTQQAASPTTREAVAPTGLPPSGTDAAGALPVKVTPVERASVPPGSVTSKSLQKLPAIPEAKSAAAGTDSAAFSAQPGSTRSPWQVSLASPGSLTRPGWSGSPTAAHDAGEPALELPLQRVIREAPLQGSVPEALPAQEPGSVAPAADTPAIETTGVGTDSPTQAQPLAPPVRHIQRADTESPASSPQARNLRPVSIQGFSDWPATVPESGPADRQALPLVARSVNTPSRGLTNRDQAGSLSELTPVSGFSVSSAGPAETPAQRVASNTRPLGLAVQRLAAEPSPIRATPRSLPLAPVPTMASIQRAQVAAMESVQTAIAESTVPFAFKADTSGRSVARLAMNLQRVEEEPAIAAGPTLSSATASSAAASPPGQATSGSTESEMDALAGKLYERIRCRLKSELLIDRERAGLLTDLR